MRILQVCPGSYEIGKGGISEHVRNISERLAKRYEVTVYATNPRGRLPRYEIVNGVRVERFRRYAPSDAYFFSLELPLRLRQVEFDVVHGHGYHALPTHFSSLAGHGRLVISTHFHGAATSAFRNSLLRLFKPFGRKTLEKADNIIAVSEYEKSLLCKQFKLDSSKVVVIPNGLNFKEFEGLKRRERDFKSILYVGRLEKYKGVQYLIEVLPKLDENVVLEIVGKGNLKPFLMECVQRLGVYNRVRFYQDLPRRELLQKFVDADVFVLLSKYEAYAMVVAEALVAGTPCIVANTSALTEWINNESCFGIDFPVNIGELAKMIVHILESGADKNAVKTLIGKKIPSWEDVVKKLEKIYTVI